jgi:spore germination cell wall hydrolase CwlJ-like protein
MAIRNRATAFVVLLVGMMFYPAESRADVTRDIKCLAQNIYFEARSEPLDGKLAVGHVVLNRVADSRYPASICEVVRQGGEEPLNKCQFSWWCDGRSDRPKNLDAWKQSMVLARVIFWGYSEDPTGGALWYHAKYVRPYWRRKLPIGPVIGTHIFYLNDRAPKVSQATPNPQRKVRLMMNARPVKVAAAAKTT